MHFTHVYRSSISQRTGLDVANKILFKISTHSIVGELGPLLNVNEKKKQRGYYIEDRKNNIRLGTTHPYGDFLGTTSMEI
jgi:hypothetical protein